MRFNLSLIPDPSALVLPVNYQYPLSAAIYRIIAGADADYAHFLHERGYHHPGSLKKFKLFCFSDLRTPFRIREDRLYITGKQAELQTGFYMPDAATHFIRGLFLNRQIEIADKKSSVRFQIQTVLALTDPLAGFAENEVISVMLSPGSPVVAGLRNEKGNYEFLQPGDHRFVESIIYNWRSKLRAVFDDITAQNALLVAEVPSAGDKPRSRLITVKAFTPEETKIRGWTHFSLRVTAEKRFIALLLDAGVGIYNSMGMGYAEIRRSIHYEA